MVIPLIKESFVFPVVALLLLCSTLAPMTPFGTVADPSMIRDLDLRNNENLRLQREIVANDAPPQIDFLETPSLKPSYFHAKQVSWRTKTGK